MGVLKCLALWGLLTVSSWGVAAEPTEEPVSRIEPDRRDFTSGTGIVPLGHVQVESGVQWSRGDTAQQVEIGALTFRIPVSPSLEFHLQLPSYRVDHSPERATGFDDAQVEARWRLYKGDALNVAIQAGLTVPTGSRRVAERTWQPGLTLASSYRWAGVWQLVASASALRATSDGERFTQAVAAASLRLDLSDAWNAFAEAYVFNRETADGPAHRYVALGTVFFPSRSLALDARVGKGIRNGSGVETFAAAGLSYRY